MSAVQTLADHSGRYSGGNLGPSATGIDVYHLRMLGDPRPAHSRPRRLCAFDRGPGRLGLFAASSPMPLRRGATSAFTWINPGRELAQ